MNIPNTSALSVQIPKDIVEDLLAKKIYESKLHGDKSVVVEGAGWQNREILDILENKGYQVTILGRSLSITWD